MIILWSWKWDRAYRLVPTRTSSYAVQCHAICLFHRSKLDWPIGSIDRTKESLLLLAFFQYLDRSNVYEMLTSGRRRVIQQIGSITAFPSSRVFIHESSEHEGISTLLGLIKSSVELETDLFAFLRNEELFQGKNYTAFVNLLRATTMQKKSEFDVMSFAAHLRFCLILVRICS